MNDDISRALARLAEQPVPVNLAQTEVHVLARVAEFFSKACGLTEELGRAWARWFLSRPVEHAAAWAGPEGSNPLVAFARRCVGSPADAEEEAETDEEEAA